MSLALYRKYRSRSLAEIVGQDHVTKLLANAIQQDRVAHAYLFTGPRGVGKTSIARILAHEINNLPYEDESTHLDIIEIDAASNNGVEDIRDLRERVRTAPVSASKKVYIIDEVHMLSKPAFNALLKTLEEPPEHVVFILATTDIDKVPDTILSRTQRHSFRRASENDIIKNLQRIAKAEKLEVEAAAYALIARHADGSFRDSVSLFDQLLSGTSGKLTADDVISSLGLANEETIRTLLSATERGDIAVIDDTLRQLESQGVPTRTTTAQLTDVIRRDLPANPGLSSLLDGLLDVSRSHYPELKLLTVLGRFAGSKNNETAVTTTLATTSPEATVAAEPNLPATITPVHTPKLESPKVTSVPSAPSKPSSPEKHASPPSDFNWAGFVDHVRKNHVALYSVLSKCEPEIDGSTLKLYTKSAFYKKKLDDAKYRLLLNSSLQEQGYVYDTETIAAAKPMKDSQAARVAAIMGGGEEVSVADDA